MPWWHANEPSNVPMQLDAVWRSERSVVVHLNE
jgi:hypothetical protein